MLVSFKEVHIKQVAEYEMPGSNTLYQQHAAILQIELITPPSLEIVSDIIKALRGPRGDKETFNRTVIVDGASLWMDYPNMEAAQAGLQRLREL